MICHGAAGVVGAILNATSVGDSGNNNNNNMRTLTMILLSFAIGQNIPADWFLSMHWYSRLALILSVGIVVNIATSWVYPRKPKMRPCNNN
jgi:hypothetical protein